MKDVCAIWKDNFGTNLSKEALIQCPGRIKGEYYLCKEDMTILKNDINIDYLLQSTQTT